MRRADRRAAIALLAVLVAVPVAAARAPAAKARSAKKGSGAPSETVLVRVAGEPITTAMVQRRLDEIPEGMRSQYGTPEGRRQLLDRLVEEKVWLVTATRAGVPERPRVQQQLESQRRDLLIRTWLSEVMAASPAPADSEARAYYDAHLDEYRVPASITLRHIQSRTEAEGRRMLQQARAKNADFAAIAKRSSTDSLTRVSGGLLGTVSREGLFGPIGAQPALAESAFTLPVGGIGGPWRTDRGWHVVMVDKKTEDSVRPFEQVRPLILRSLSGQRSQEFYRTLLEKARQDLGVEPDSTAIRDFVSRKKGARDLFEEAQAAVSVQDRLALYRQLLEEHPDADVAPQAQFMVGFIHSEELKDYDGAEQAFRELLRRYPKSELTNSARWMIEHMRSEDVPSMLRLDADSASVAAPADTTHPKAKGTSGTP